MDRELSIAEDLLSYQARQAALIRMLQTNYLDTGKKPTLVPIQKDYEGTRDRCLTLVGFFDPVVSDRISRTVIAPLRAVEPKHFYYPPDALHITVKNVRTAAEPPLFTDEQADRVGEAFAEVLADVRSLEFSLRGLLRLPTSISVVGYCDDYFARLVRTLDNVLKEVEVPDDKRYVSQEIFFANSTVCRFRDRPSQTLLERVLDLADLDLGVAKLSSLQLLSCNPACAAHSRRVFRAFALR
jgi:hypothetical protein